MQLLDTLRSQFADTTDAARALADEIAAQPGRDRVRRTVREPRARLNTALERL